MIIGIGSVLGSNDDDDSSSSSSSRSQSSVSKQVKKKKKAAVQKNTAKAVTLGAGMFKVGSEIKPGRYIIEAASGSGNLISKNGEPDINVILGTTVGNDLGQVTSYTTDLTKGQKIQLSGIQSTKFIPTPSKRTYKTTLGAGNWVVGKDIKAGHYEIKAVQGSGNLTSDNGYINEILGTTADDDLGQVTKVTADLDNGETLSTTL